LHPNIDIHIKELHTSLANTVNISTVEGHLNLKTFYASNIYTPEFYISRISDFDANKVKGLTLTTSVAYGVQTREKTTSIF